MKKTAVITGSAQGIGSAAALAFAHNGYNTVCIDNNKEALESFVKEHAGSTLTPCLCDVSDDNDLKKAAAFTVKTFGGIDCLVNNAYISANKKIKDLSREEWNRVLSVNLTAPLFLVKYFEESLRKTKGCIVNIASTRALMSEPDTEAYSAAKGGLLSLTHALAMSLAPDVRVNSISPGWIDVTHLKRPLPDSIPALSEADHLQHPAGRVGRAEDIAEMILYLCSEKAGFITGQNFVIDGGMTKKMIYV